MICPHLLQLFLKQNLVLTGKQLEFFLFDATVTLSLGQASETRFKTFLVESLSEHVPYVNVLQSK